MAKLDLFFEKDVSDDQMDKTVQEALVALQNSSLAYDYIKSEWDKSRELWSKDDLADQMDAYKQMYFHMRTLLSEMRPDLLDEMESELLTLRNNHLFSQSPQTRLPQ